MFGPDHPAVAYVLNELGGLYLAKGDYFKAEQVDLEALALFERAQKAEIYEVSSIANALGNIYYLRGDYRNAENYYQRSRSVLEKIFGPDHFHLASSYTSLGRVAYDSGDYKGLRHNEGRGEALRRVQLQLLHSKDHSHP